MHYFTQLKKLLILPILFFTVTAHAQVNFTVTTAESTCQANGTISIIASGGTGPYQYQITAGPSGVTLPPPQSPVNVFNALPAGTYSVKVVDLGTNGGPFSEQTSIVVPGTYIIPTMNPVPSSPLCFNTADGKIAANASGGSLPYTFELVAPSTIAVGPQSSDTFENLPAGNYSLRLTDGCGNIQTRVVTVNPTGGTIVNSGYIEYITKSGCDLFRAAILVGYYAETDYKPPYTINYTTSNGVGDTTVVITNFSPGSNITPDYFRISGYNTTASYTITNGCGYTSPPFSFTPTHGIAVTGFNVNCQAAYQVYMPAYVNNRYGINQFYKAPVTYVLTNTDTGVEVASQTDNPTFTGFPQGNYKVVLTDACGTTDETNFIWEVLGPPEVLVTKRTDSCLDSTLVLGLSLRNSKMTGVRFLSGPPSASSTKTGYSYFKNYSFPTDIILPDYADNNGPSLILAGVAPGDYVVEVSGECGPPIQVNISILPSEVTSISYGYSYVQGCTDANTIHIEAIQNNGPSYIGQSFVITNSLNAVVASGGGYIVNEDFHNLPSDTYKLTLTIANVWPGFFNCDVIYEETIVIPPYSQPDINLIVQALCGTTSYALVQPDPFKGAGPFTYAIRQQGDVPYGAFQASPEFAIAVPGIYDVQMIDGCGNSVSRSVSMGTVTFPAPTKTGDGCIGSTNTQLSMPANDYYSYQWKRPNGAIATGNILPINPVTAADLGTYELTTTTNLTGCTSSNTTTVTLGSNCTLPVKLVSFSAEESERNVILKWKTTEEESMKGYSIERSVNTRSFASVGYVASENSKQLKDWMFTDKTVISPQTYYYRLKMLNADNSFAYSTMRVVPLGEPDETLQLFANPVGSGLTNLKLPRLMQNGLIKVSIFSSDGRNIANETIQATNSVVQLTKLSSLVSGSYLLTVQDISGIANTIRFIVP